MRGLGRARSILIYTYYELTLLYMVSEFTSGGTNSWHGISILTDFQRWAKNHALDWMVSPYPYNIIASSRRGIIFRLRYAFRLEAWKMPAVIHSQSLYSRVFCKKVIRANGNSFQSWRPPGNQILQCEETNNLYSSKWVTEWISDEFKF